MTTPARKPASRVRAAPVAAPVSAGAATAPRKTSKAASSAGSPVGETGGAPGGATGDVPGQSTPASFRSVVIESVSPELDGGRYPVKREVGQTFVVEADLFKEGHDLIGARVVYRAPGSDTWQSASITLFDNDRWRGSFELTELGCYTNSSA